MGILDIFKSSKQSDAASEGGRLFLIAKGGINVLETAYKSLSNKGKLEVILFNSVSVLGIFKDKYPHRYSAAEDEFFRALINQCKEYGIKFNSEMLDFVNSRFQFYSKEIENIFTSKKRGGSFVPADTYTAFYLTPLSVDIKSSFGSHLPEIIKFFAGLTVMWSWVHDNMGSI